MTRTPFDIPRNQPGLRPHWWLAGAGNIGTLAAWYLSRAGHDITVLGKRAGPRPKRLIFADGRAPISLTLTTGPASPSSAPITHLAIACKTPFTRDVLDRLTLADDVVVLRLQNGIGDLSRCLPANARLIETITTNAVKGQDPTHEIVAENQTFMGDGHHVEPPFWFDELCGVWPGLEWRADIRMHQWHKLVANAAINPLTALHDVANGVLLTDATLHAHLCDIVGEADILLTRLDPAWPGDSLAGVEAIARATAGNTSSMRADVQRGAPTEIAAINGWLLSQAKRVGLRLPVNERVVAELLKFTG